MTRFVIALAAVTIVMAAAAPTSAVSPPDDPAVDEGPVMIARPDRPDEWLLEGDSSSAFAIRLPVGAACPGDSRNDQYRVQSFIVPATVDLASLSYSDVGPTGTHQFALYNASPDQTSYAQVLTAPNETPRRPGIILELPVFGFAVYPQGALPAGRYSVGVACTYFRWTTNYWSTEIDIIDEPVAVPGGFRWSVVESADVVPRSDDKSSLSRWLLAAGLVPLALLAATYVVGRRRQTTDEPPPPKETVP